MSTAARLLGERDAPLDLADVVEVVVEAREVARAQAPLQPTRVREHGVQDAAILALARRALLGRAAVAEQALEHDLRVALHRQRRGRRGPRDRVRVGAAVADAADAERADVLDAHLERGQGALLADLAREHLVDRDAGLDVLAFGALRMRGAQDKPLPSASGRRRFPRGIATSPCGDRCR